MTLGKKLQMLRKSRGMSQEQLADALDVSRQAVSKWELDQTLPDTANVVALGKMFGVTTDYLLVEETEESRSSAPAAPQHHKPNTRTVLGIIVSAFGALGVFTTFVISRFVEVMLPHLTTINGKQMIEYRSDFLGINYIEFLKTYHLKGLVIFLALLVPCGVAIVFWNKIKVRFKK